MPDTHPPALDDIDRQLIAALQLNARESVAMLARQLGIARTTVTSRLARLEKTQVITGYGVRLGQRVVDGGLQAYVGITVVRDAQLSGEHGHAFTGVDLQGGDQLAIDFIEDGQGQGSSALHGMARAA